MINEISLKSIKRIIKIYYNGEITTKTCIYVRNLVLNYTECLIEECVKEFEDYNLRRKKHNLPILKRLNTSVFVNFSDKIYKPLVDKNNGEVGQSNNLLLGQDSDIIRKNRDDVIIKDADVEVA